MIKNPIVKEDIEYIYNHFEKPEFFQNKTVMITGFAGFLGYYLTNYFCSLSEKGIHLKSLVLLDTFIICKPQWTEELSDKPFVKIVDFDISCDDFYKIDDIDNVDYVIHMASIASPTYYRKFPIKTVEANVFGLRNLLEFYKNKSLEGLLFFSSSEVYGDPPEDKIPTDEEYTGNVFTMSPRACYDEAKRLGETLCYLYAKEHNMPIRIVRPFNNYGPGMNVNDKRVPADFARDIMNNKDIVIYSDGSPKRTFCYIADAIVGFLKALTYNKFDYFNIGLDSSPTSVLELAEIYRNIGAKLFNYSGKIDFEISDEKDYLTHNPKNRCPIIKKARTLLDYKPEIDIMTGIERYLKYLEWESGRS